MIFLMVWNYSFSWVGYIKTNGGNFELYPNNSWCDDDLPAIGEEEYKPGTIGYIPTKLGYLSDEWYMWLTCDMEVVIFKSFSTDIIAILLNSEKEISDSLINSLLEGFNYNKEFKIEDALRGKIRQCFIEEVLHKKAVEGKIVDEINGYTYAFTNGLISSWAANDGIQGYAKEFKDTPLFEMIKSNAKRKHTLDKDAIEEINFQFECFAKMQPHQIKLAYNKNLNYNIALVWFALYGVAAQAPLNKFLLCVPDAEPIDIATNSITLKWGSNLFKFDNEVLTEVM